MQALDEFVIIGMLRTYVDETLVGMGALKGAPCTIKSITSEDGVHTVQFEWVDADGDSHTSDLVVTDGEKGETGETGATGATGNGISKIEKTSTEGLVDTYTITYTDGTTSTFTVTNGDVTVFTGATAQNDGAKGAVPGPEAGDEEKLLCGDGTWTDKCITEAQWASIQSILQ